MNTVFPTYSSTHFFLLILPTHSSFFFFLCSFKILKFKKKGSGTREKNAGDAPRNPNVN